MRRNFNEWNTAILLIFLIIALTVTTVICEEVSMENMYERECIEHNRIRFARSL